MEKLKKELDGIISKYVSLFEEKHGIEFDFWVADLTGTIACFSCEWYVDFETIRLDLEKDCPPAAFMNWYNLSLNLAMEKKTVINYYSFLKGAR